MPSEAFWAGFNAVLMVINLTQGKPAWLVALNAWCFGWSLARWSAGK
jgi:hypothetical protein